MGEPAVDYSAVFRALPGMVALLTPDLAFADVSEDFVRLSGRSREQLVGRCLFDVFPDNPNDPAATGARNLETSLRRVLTSGRRDTMTLQRYDVESLERPGHWEERYWSPINVPVLDADGRVVFLVHRVEEVTELIRARGRAVGDRARVLEAQLYTRFRELQGINEQLRSAHAREREVALALQEAMLPAPHLAENHQAAVRYRPAIEDIAHIQREREDRLAALVRSAGAHYPAVHALHQIGTGSTAGLLVGASQRADLLVTGARRHADGHGLLLGPVTQVLLHHARCPVAVVPLS